MKLYLKLGKFLLVRKSGNCVDNSGLFARIDGAANDSTVFFKGLFQLFFCSVGSQAANESHKVFFGSKRSENKRSGRLNFKVDVEVFQCSFTGFDTGVSDDGFAGLSIQSLDSDFLSQFTKLDEFILNVKEKIRKDLSQV